MKKLLCLVFILVASTLQVWASSPADEGNTFLESFYKEGARCDFSPTFLKMYLTKNAVKYLQDTNPDLRLALAAPTGKAAARMTESMAKAGVTAAPATTIHALLGAQYDLVSFRHGRENPLSVDWLIVDEASMIGMPLMSKLLDALPDGCRLTLVGDVDQLASVERR